MSDHIIDLIIACREVDDTAHAISKLIRIIHELLPEDRGRVALVVAILITKPPITDAALVDLTARLSGIPHGEISLSIRVKHAALVTMCSDKFSRDSIIRRNIEFDALTHVAYV